MPATLQEITGVFLGERFRKGDWCIGTIRLHENGCAPSTIKGTAEPDELTTGLEYRFYGRQESHPRYGESFAFKTFVRATPHGRAGTIRYLQEAPHVGQKTAEILWNKFQGDAVRILREEPEVAAAAVGGRFTTEKATEAAAMLEQMAALEDCSIELIDLLGGRGFPRDTGRKAVREWGNRAAEFIKRNPYLLMAFRGCGFLRCDAMYLDLGGNPARLKRQALCIWHSLASDSEGHTWLPVSHIVRALQQKISSAQIRGPQACLLAKRAGMIETRRDAENQLWVAEAAKARAEEYVAEKVAEAMAEEYADWPAGCDLKGLSGHQCEQVLRAIEWTKIGILGGSPGTGKTYTSAALIRALTAEHGRRCVAIACPTGKAAVRCTEALTEYGISLQATTIHRLLVVESVDGGAGWRFQHNELTPLPYRFVVIDESSMVDTGLMSSLLAARAKGTHILCVGDVNQLPPVGHGAPLRDMIAAGVPTGELREIHRNAGTIVRACAQIRDGERFATDEGIAPCDTPPRNLKLVPATNGKQAVEKILGILRKLREWKLCDPVWDCQVVVAVNEKSPLSRRELNRLLQAELNPEEVVPGSPFRLGDKVIQLKNGFLLAANSDDGDEDGRFFVANGEQGRVVEVMAKLTVVKFTNPDRLVKIPRGKAEGDEGSKSDDDSGTGCDLDLAYAVTCHKLQGSEAPIVIVALDNYPGARRVCSREWLYTAISRAKKVCFLVGKKSTADAMCRRLALNKRKTFLSEKIHEFQEVLEEAGSSAPCAG